MHAIRRFVVAFAVILLGAAAAPHLQAQTPSIDHPDNALTESESQPMPSASPLDVYWDDRLGPPGANGMITAVAVHGSDVYVAGSFSTIGGITAYGIARWDGHAWHALGSGVAGSVSSIVVLRNGDVYAGGNLVAAGGDSVKGVARWDGKAWHALGSGILSSSQFYVPIYSMTTDGDNLYVAGGFTAAGGVTVNNVAKWDGSAWSALGNGIASPATAVAYGGGKLYVSSTNIVAWDGTQWTTLGVLSPTPDPTYPQTYPSVMVVDGGTLYLAGAFAQINGVVANGLARWDGTAWHPIGSGLIGFSPNANLISAMVIDHGDLYVGGTFSVIGDYIEANGLARWNGSYWSSVGRGVRTKYNQYYTVGRVQAMALADSGLFIGGEFQTAGGVEVNRITRWRATEGFIGLRGGSNSAVAAVAPLGDSVWIGGNASAAGGQLAGPLAIWSPALSSTPYYYYPVVSGVGLGAVDVLLPTPDYLFAAGRFGLNFQAAGAVNILKWNSSLWTVLEDEDKYGVDGAVRALAIDGRMLYAGGAFTHAAGRSASHIAVWNGEHWSGLGEGFDGTVNAIAIMDGRVYAGGEFTHSGELPLNHIAVWDGAAWSEVLGGVDSVVNALAASGSNLYVGGRFTRAGSVPVRGIARLSAGAWNDIGGGGLAAGAGASVNAIAPFADGIFIGGRFAGVGGTAASNIARFDGVGWRALGSGINGDVHTLAIGGGALVAGGQFTEAGGRPSYNLARWKNLSAGVTGSTAVTVVADARVEPNPIDGAGRLSLTLASAADVAVRLYDPAGRMRATIFQGHLEGGTHGIALEVADLPAGAYFCRIASGGRTKVVMVVRR